MAAEFTWSGGREGWLPRDRPAPLRGGAAFASDCDAGSGGPSKHPFTPSPAPPPQPTRSKHASASTWHVCGNMSNGTTARTAKPAACSSGRSRCSACGSHDT